MSDDLGQALRTLRVAVLAALLRRLGITIAPLSIDQVVDKMSDREVVNYFLELHQTRSRTKLGPAKLVTRAVQRLLRWWRRL